MGAFGSLMPPTPGHGHASRKKETRSSSTKSTATSSTDGSRSAAEAARIAVEIAAEDAGVWLRCHGGTAGHLPVGCQNSVLEAAESIPAPKGANHGPHRVSAANRPFLRLARRGHDCVLGPRSGRRQARGEGRAPVVAVLLASAKGSGADPVTNFRRSNRLYREAMSYNRGLDRDNDKIACEKH
jgi:Excalibur calcium-binding domain